MANLDFIYNRKSVRQFKDTPVPKEDIIELLKAGTITISKASAKLALCSVTK